MKIAIPIADGRLAMHFGHCESFALVEADEENGVQSVSTITPPPHAPGVLPQFLAENGADMIIASGMGRRAQMLFDQAGIKVVVGAPSEGPKEIVEAYLDGDLETGENVCDH